MNRQGRMIGVVGILIGTIYAATATAAPVGTAFTYQGSLMELGEPVNETADFRFRLWDAAVAGNGVGSHVSVTGIEVVNGLFSVEVDFGVDPYTTNQALWLEIEVRSPTGQGQFETLSPRQELTPTPFSLATRGINVNADGEVGIATTDPQAKLHIGGRPGVDGIMFPDGTLQTSAGGGGGGNTLDQAYDQGGPGAGRIITADSGSIRINGDGLLVDGPFSSTNHALNIYAITEGDTVHAHNDGFGRAGSFFSRGSGIEVATNGDASSKVLRATHSGLGDCGFFAIENADSQGEAVEARTNGTGDAVQAWNTGTGRAGFFRIDNANSGATALFCTSNGSQRTFQAWNSGTGTGGYFRIDNASSDATALVCTTIGTGLSLHVARGTDASPEGGGFAVIGFTNGRNLVFDDNEIMARVNGQTSTLYLNNDGGAVRVPLLEITGADLAEKFPVSDKPEPGMVVEIDPDRTGTLRIARGGAYNPRVAGIVSGANNLPVGAVLGHLPGHENAPPIALSGRVWVQCDASTGAIKPGDLLTTSNAPGHAMKATDRARAYGATIGKAMSSLKDGRGLVLVLVSLQ